MSILPDHALFKWAVQGGIEPFDTDCINPASVDLRISTNSVIPLQGQVCKRGALIRLGLDQQVLVSTIEYIKMPHNCAGVLYLKSSLVRQGLDHALAGFVDPGFEGELTLELYTHCPIVLTHNQRVVQLVLYRLESAPTKTYQGKYQGQRGPTGRVA